MTDISSQPLAGSAAEAYERHFVPAIAMPVAAGLLDAAALQPGDRVLDVACGTGLVARLAAARVGAGGAVTGVDVSPDMVAVARTTPAPQEPVIVWRVEDATALPHPDGSFDVVLCQLGLMFMADKAAALREMRRVLVPGGRIVLTTPGTIQPPFALMEQALADHLSAEVGGFVRTVFSMHDPDQVGALLRDADLVDVAAREYTVTLALGPPAAFLWQYISSTPLGPLVARASAEAQAAMERQVVETWAPYVVDGGTPVVQPMVLVTGRR